jgi:diguanylate cyclase (GGDEF)-like protein
MDSKNPPRSSKHPASGQTRPSRPSGAHAARPSIIEPAWLDEVDDGRQTDTSIEIPAPPRAVGGHAHAILRMVAGINAGQVFALERAESIVGRGREASVRIEDAGVSRLHTKIVKLEGDRLRVEDLGSTNGTWVGGERIKSAEISAGEVVQIGPNVVLSFSLVDEVEERLSRQLFESSTRDALTGAYNRKYLMTRLASEVAYSNRHGSKLAVILFDLDHFKKVNDGKGHLAGDEVLRVVSAQVARMIRAEDVFGRYGGEEFVILVRGIEGDNVRLFAERVRRAIEKLRVPFGGDAIVQTISVGVAALDECGDVGTMESLLLLADERLYRAKHTGRNRVVATDG